MVILPRTAAVRFPAVICSPVLLAVMVLGCTTTPPTRPTIGPYPPGLFVENRGGPGFTIRISGDPVMEVPCYGAGELIPGENGSPRLPWDLSVTRQRVDFANITIYKTRVTELPRWLIQIGDSGVGIATVAVAGPPGPSCPPADQLLALLPETAGGVTFERISIVDDSLDVGHLVDAVLQKLGRTRGDATPVVRWSSTADAQIGAFRITGVDGATALRAFVQTWRAPATIGRLQLAPEEWVLSTRGGSQTVIYESDEIVFVIGAPDRATIEAIIADMPSKPDS